MKTVSSYKYLIYLFSLILLSLIDINNSLKLRGVTIPNWPYVERYEGESGSFKYDGYLIDLINKISLISGFEYDLYYSSDLNYGRVDRYGRMNGIIGEVYDGKADFAIADLTITDERRRYIDFTEPFMKSGISALIRKSNVGDMKTFSDLFYQTEVKYGVITDSHTYRYFYESKEPIIKKMNAFMLQNPQVFVNSKKMGIDKVNTTNYALILDSASLEFAASVYCDLTVINDTTQEFPDFTRHYAIALKKGSKYLNAFNLALNELEKSGQLDDLKQKYWVDQCTRDELEINSSFSINYEYQTNFIYILVIMLSVKNYLTY